MVGPSDKPFAPSHGTVKTCFSADSISLFCAFRWIDTTGMRFRTSGNDSKVAEVQKMCAVECSTICNFVSANTAICSWFLNTCGSPHTNVCNYRHYKRSTQHQPTQRSAIYKLHKALFTMLAIFQQNKIQRTNFERGPEDKTQLCPTHWPLLKLCPKDHFLAEKNARHIQNFQIFHFSNMG